MKHMQNSLNSGLTHKVKSHGSFPVSYSGQRFSAPGGTKSMRMKPSECGCGVTHISFHKSSLRGFSMAMSNAVDLVLSLEASPR